MHPVLFTFPGLNFPVRSYGVLLMIGVLLALWLSRKRAPQFGIHPDKLYDALFWMLIPGILGARIMYVGQNWSYYMQNQDQLWSVQFAGLTSFGGMIFGFIGFWVWSAIHKVDRWAFLDTVGVPVLLAHAIGRIGCLMNGCCYGPPGTEWYCVTLYAEDGNHQFYNAGRFLAAQAFDTIMCLIFAGVLLGIEKGRRFASGQSFSIAIIAYGLSRFIYEFWRAGEPEVVNGVKVYVVDKVGSLPITTGQGMALLLVLVGIGLFIGRRKSSPSLPLQENPA